MTNKTEELTGKQLTERYFTEVMGWEKSAVQVDHALVDREWEKGHIYFSKEGDKYYGFDLPNHKPQLPKLHEGIEALGLQEKWVWPELDKINEAQVTFEKNSAGNVHYCSIHYAMFSATGPTKAIAQLTAALKALEKI